MTDTRLSVNLNAESAAALRTYAAEKTVSITETIRRAISVWNFIEQERRKGNGFAVVEYGPNGEHHFREVIWF